MRTDGNTMTARWSGIEVRVVRHIGNDGCQRETWRLSFLGGVLTLRGYVREVLPSRRHRIWRVVDVWGGTRKGDDTMALSAVPMSNALAVEMLAAVTGAMRVRPVADLPVTLPSDGYLLSGLDDVKAEIDAVVDSTTR
jgi:hypothetical protein